MTEFDPVKQARLDWHDPRPPVGCQSKARQAVYPTWLRLKAELNLPAEMTLGDWLAKIAPATDGPLN